MTITARIRKRIQREFFSRFYKDKGGENDFIFIAGSGRSGTTWIADSICQMYNFRLVFEPFWHLHLEVDGTGDFFHHRFIEPGDSSYDEEIQHVLLGNYKKFKINRNYRYGPYQGRVIKDICSNLFLKRIKTLYPNALILFIIRNPFAVVSSRLRKGEWAKPWRLHAHLFNSQDSLWPQCGVGNRVFPTNELEDHIISYCYENYLPLKWYLEDSSIFKLVPYEEALLNPMDSFKEISEYINSHKDFNQENSFQEIVNRFKMSSKKSQKEIKNSKKNQILKWKKYLQDEQINQIKNILLKFRYDKVFEKTGLLNYLEI